MGVEQRELLMAVNDIPRIVDVERHGLRRSRVAGAVEIDHHPHQADQIAQVRCILPARDGRLRAQVPAAIRQAATGQLERRIEPEPIEVVGVFAAAGNGEDAGAQNIGQQMGDPVRIAPVGDYSGELVGDAQPPLRLRQQHDPAIGTDPSAVEGGGDRLAADGGKAERQKFAKEGRFFHPIASFAPDGDELHSFLTRDRTPAPSELDESDDSGEPPFDVDPDPEADELDDVEAAA